MEWRENNQDDLKFWFEKFEIKSQKGRELLLFDLSIEWLMLPFLNLLLRKENAIKSKKGEKIYLVFFPSLNFHLSSPFSSWLTKFDLFDLISLFVSLTFVCLFAKILESVRINHFERKIIKSINLNIHWTKFKASLRNNIVCNNRQL